MDSETDERGQALLAIYKNLEEAEKQEREGIEPLDASMVFENLQIKYGYRLISL